MNNTTTDNTTQTHGRVSLLWPLFRGRRLRLGLLILMAALSVLFQFLSPQVIRFTVDSVLGDAPPAWPQWVVNTLYAIAPRDALRANLWILAILAAVVALGGMLTNLARRYLVAEVSEFFTKRLRDKLFSHVQRLPQSFHVKSQTGDILQRLTADVDTVKDFISTQLGEMLRSIFLILIALMLMWSMDPFMTLMSLCLMPLVFLFSWRFSLVVSKSFLAADEAEGQLQAVAQENLTGVRVVRAFGREDFEVKKFQEKNKIVASLYIRMSRVLGFFWGFGDILMGLQVVLVAVVGVFRATNGLLSPGTFLTFYMYVNMMVWPIRNLGRLLSDMSKAGVSAGRLSELLRETPELSEEETLVETPRKAAEASHESLSFSHVSFAYNPDVPVLQDISFTVSPGQTLGILGPTGSGKSTLFYLLLRLFDLPPENGHITLGDTDIRDIKLTELRRRIACVPQEPFLFSKTLAENIRAGSPTASQEAMEAAARAACCHETILSFDNGYDTLVGERGVTLSGGQRQRVALARALLQDAPILLLDDSLSAVDVETDEKIRRALTAHRENRITLIIAHRLSSVRDADHILVLRDGSVAEEGSHDTLMPKNGLYRRLYDLQEEVSP